MKSKLILAVVALFLTIPAFAQGAAHSVTLTWTPSTTVTTDTLGYNVLSSTSSGTEAVISPLTSPNGVTCTSTLCTYVDSRATLTAGTTYFYEVETVDTTTKAISGPSNEVSTMIPVTIVIPTPANLKITISQ